MNVFSTIGLLARNCGKRGARVGMPIVLVGGLIGPVVLSSGQGANPSHPILAVAERHGGSELNS